MNEWEKFLDRRTKNIGFISRLGAFRDPTPAEKESALSIEIKSWQNSKGNKPFTISEEYSNSLGYGFNLKATREAGDKVSGDYRKPAMNAYQNTPIDIGTNEKFWRPINLFKYLFNKLIKKETKVVYRITEEKE